MPPLLAARAAASAEFAENLRGEDQRGDPEADEEGAKQVRLEQAHRKFFPYRIPCVASPYSKRNYQALNARSARVHISRRVARSMAEVSHPGEGHGDSGVVGAGDDLVVAHRAA